MRVSRELLAAWASFVLVVFGPLVAEGQEPGESVPLVFGADEVHLDARSKAIDAVGHVHVDELPFHLTSDALRLRRVAIGAELEGEGRLSFCPCLGTPLAVRFRSATVAPPHDVILRNPVLEVFGLPVAWAPALWLRSPGRVGLLPPELAWRGADGLFAAASVHLPWHDGDVARGVDLRAGAYFDGGAAVDVTMRTSRSVTRVAWDRLRDDGLTLAARGTTWAATGGGPSESVAWKLDALRGVRAVKMTTDLDTAARPYDRAAAEIAWLLDGWTIGSSVRSTAVRGGDLRDLGATGPVLVARRSAGLSSWGSYDATAEGGALVIRGTGTLSFARAEGGGSVAGHLGALGTTLAVRGLGAVSDDGTRFGLDAAGELRAVARLPLVREFVSSDDGDPWVHRTEPRVEAAVIGVGKNDSVLPAGRGMAVPPGGAWLATGGWFNTLGRAGPRDSAELDVAVGAVGHFGRSGTPPRPLLRSRASWQAPWLGWTGEVARVLARATETGGALIAHGRLGPSTGLHLLAHVAERDGVDPVAARALVEAPVEPAGGFLDVSGWTGGARVAVPIGRRVTTRAGADVDLTSRDLVAALGSLELHDPCNCVVVRATVAHRIGRDGVDVWVSVDLPAR